MGPTDREIELALKWMRVARLVSLSLETRLERVRCQNQDGFEDYGVLAALLDDSVVDALFEDGEVNIARALRNEHRRRYLQLTRDFVSRAEAEWKQSLMVMDTRGEWTGYTWVFWRRWLGIGVSALLRGALTLHTMRAPGGCAIARLATRYIQQCFSPGAKIIPIRAS
jgi:hypothetical protein